MKPGHLDLPTIWRGCIYQAVKMAWQDAEGNPIDLTGWRPRAYARDFQFDVQVTNYRGGLTTLSLPASATAKLDLGVSDWDFIWWEPVAPGTVSKPFLSGKVEVKEPVTDPSTHVVGRISGGSVFIKMFPGNVVGNRFLSLIGRYHQTWPFAGQPLPDPPPDPGTAIPVRAQAQAEMAQMRANDQTKISFMIWFYHAYLSVPDPQVRRNLDYIKGIYLLPYNAQEGNLFVTLTDQQQQNLIDLMWDIRNAGFTQLNVRFHPEDYANDDNWPEIGEETPDKVHTFINDRYLHNRNYIFSIIDIIQANRGNLNVVYDLGSEHANIRMLNHAKTEIVRERQDRSLVHRTYCRLLWGAYLNRIGPFHSMAFSILGGVDSRLGASAGAIALIDLLNENHLEFPAYFGLDSYGDPTPSDVYDSLVTWFDYTKKNAPGEQLKPFILQETLYNDGAVASQIERVLFNRKNFNFHSIFQWPQIRGHSGQQDSGPYIFPDVYPHAYSAYHTL